VGCGVIGRRRAGAFGGATLTACMDVDPSRARQLAETHAAKAVLDIEDVVDNPDIDVVVVSTTNNMLAPVAIAALEAGKHVFVEKPAARSVAEITRVIADAAKAQRLVRVGFNHRYH